MSIIFNNKQRNSEKEIGFVVIRGGGGRVRGVGIG